MSVITKLMIYLYFFVCPIEFVINHFTGSSVKYIALAAAALIIIYLFAHEEVKIKLDAVKICIIAWISLEAMSFLWTIKIDDTFASLISYVLMAFFLICICFFPFEKRDLENIMIVSTASSVLISVLLLTSNTMYNDYNSAGRMVVEVFGASQNPNGLAASMITGIMYSFVRTFKKDKLRILYGLLFVVQTVAMLFTGSRGAFVAVLFGIIAFLFASLKGKNRIKVIFIFIISVAVLYLILYFALPEALYDRIFNFENYSGGTGRINLWRIAFEQIAYHPLFGSGVYSHAGYFLRERGIANAMHNTYLAVIFEVGVFGFFFFIFPFAATVIKSLKKNNNAVFCIVAANMASAFFLDSLQTRYLWNALIIGLVFYTLSSQNETEPVKEND